MMRWGIAMKTQAEIDALKRAWLEAPWDNIYERKGFESHREELEGFQQDAEESWERRRQNCIEAKADALDVSVEVAEKIYRQEWRAKEMTRLAASLSHYYSDILPKTIPAASCNEANSMLDSISEATIEATHCYSQIERLKRMQN